MSDNETLEDIALPALEEITGDLILRNALVKNINLPLLASVGETFNITTDNLTSVNVNMLSFIGDDLTLIGSTTATESSDIESIVFPQLKKSGWKHDNTVPEKHDIYLLSCVGGNRWNDNS